jgi:nitrate/nitrite transport system substrate-binding protein
LKFAKWWVTQLRRWGFVSGAPDYDAVAKQVMRPDIYEEAMKELGVKHGGPDEQTEKLFDGSVFDPKADGETYARSFRVHSLKG